MMADPLLARIRQLGLRAQSWPPLLRDAAAASLALLTVSVGEFVAMILPLPPEALLALPGGLLAWWVLGRSSAAFGVLVAALAASLLAADRMGAAQLPAAREVLMLLALALSLVTACLAALAWARGRERRAALLIDACAGDALARIAAAETRLAAAEAKAQAAQAELGRATRALAVLQRGQPAARDPAFDNALRSEGGV